MCGIAGFVGKTKRKDLQKMIDLLRYRGPDGEGIFWSEHAGLANRRLAIIDIKDGKQPLTNENGNLTITYNGEIYNYKDLRKQLEKKGHRFKTRSDTEVIIHAFEEYGVNCLQKFNGMFAFAIWDSKNKTLFAARDRLGIKPLFYSKTANNFLFASEIKSLLVHPEVKKEINFSQIANYLTFRYIPEPNTIFKEIFHLRAGFYLIYKNDSLTIERYWQLPFGQEINIPESEAIDNFLNLLKDSVKMRLNSEVPLGSFISGGIDSSLITTLASWENKDITNFYIAFRNRHYDETEPAEYFSKWANLPSKRIVYDQQFNSYLPKIIWHLDQPLADAAIIPTYFLAQLARKTSGVVLSGDGADEIFAGYNHYHRLIHTSQLSLFFLPALSLLEKLHLQSLISKRASRFLHLGQGKIKHFLSLVDVFPQEQVMEITTHDFNKYFQPELTEDVISSFFTTGEDHLLQLLKTDLSIWLPSDILLKTDRMTMAHGLEARVPYLDYRLVELLLRLPSKFKQKLFTNKYIERKAAAKILPYKIVNRKKHGFDVPLSYFCKLTNLLLTKKSIKKRGWFIPEKVETIIHDKDDRLHINQAFSLLVLEIWAQIFMDNQNVDGLNDMLKNTVGK